MKCGQEKCVSFLGRIIVLHVLLPSLITLGPGVKVRGSIKAIAYFYLTCYMGVMVNFMCQLDWIMECQMFG
jgi:hypothetical protein